MFDCIKKLFGEGKFYFYFETTDGQKGRAKVAYIGDPSTMTSEDIKELKRRCELEYGISFTKFEYQGRV